MINLNFFLFMLPKILAVLIIILLVNRKTLRYIYFKMSKKFLINVNIIYAIMIKNIIAYITWFNQLVMFSKMLIVKLFTNSIHDNTFPKSHAFIKNTLKSTLLGELTEVITNVDLYGNKIYDCINVLNDLLTTNKAKIVYERSGDFTSTELLVFNKIYWCEELQREQGHAIFNIRYQITDAKNHLTNWLNQAKSIESNISSSDPTYRSQILDRIRDFERLKEAYPYKYITPESDYMPRS